MRFSSGPARLVAALALTLGVTSCTPDPAPDGPAADGTTLCAAPGETYGIQDFPCPAATVEGWVAARDEARIREHGWYLFAGLNRLQADGRALWRTWPTSTQAFPGQFTAGSYLAETRAAVGARLEHPAPRTPRFVGQVASNLAPGVSAATLSLPGDPTYTVPGAVANDPTFRACVRVSGLNRSLIDGPTIQNNGDVMLAGVIYSPDAAAWIQNRNLNDADSLDARLPASATAAAVQLDMNPDAVVLKPMLWPVRHDGFTALPLWDNGPPDADRIGPCEVYSGFERTSLWTRAVALTADPAREADSTTATATFLAGRDVSRAAEPYVPFPPTDSTHACQPRGQTSGAIVYADAPVVPLDRFYQVRYTQQELDAMDPCDRALLDQSAYWSFGRAFEAEDALVLIAMHMMTKEQTGWTFQSAWWFDGALGAACTGGDARSQAACRHYASDRPSGVEGPGTWQNYLLTTTYGVPGPSSGAPETTAAEAWPIAFNPYIELAATHPIETNCRNCHLRAAWPGALSSAHDRRFPDRRPGAYLTEGPGAPGLLDSLGYGDAIFRGLVTVDAVWSISDRATYSGH